MWPDISPASGDPVSAILALIRLCPVFHISGVAAGLGDLVEQHLARLHVGDDGGAGVGLQHVAGQDHQKLVAEQHRAGIVDHADPVGVAVERDAEISPALAHLGDQLRRSWPHRGVRMVVGKGAVDLREKHRVLPGSPDTGAAGRRRRPRCRCPTPRSAARSPPSQSCSRRSTYSAETSTSRSLPAASSTTSPAAAMRPISAICGAEERLACEHHLEAVVVGRVVAAGQHHGAIRLQVVAAKYSIGVGPRPIRITSMPLASGRRPAASTDRARTAGRHSRPRPSCRPRARPRCRSSGRSRRRRRGAACGRRRHGCRIRAGPWGRTSCVNAIQGHRFQYFFRNAADLRRQVRPLQREGDLRLEEADLVAAIEPPALVAQAVERHVADHAGHRVGQLHLVAGAALHEREIADHLGRQHVAADDGQVGRRVRGLGLFDQAASPRPAVRRRCRCRGCRSGWSARAAPRSTATTQPPVSHRRRPAARVHGVS